MAATLKRQALILTLANVYTRALGFVLRLVSARLMGAEAMGVMELASSGMMLAITPVTAGLPAAMSRLTAQRGADQKQVLHAGITLVKRLSLLLIPLMTFLSPLMAWLLGDLRTLPALLTSAPAIWLLGLCAVYSGWCYGMDDARTPALNECVEQTVRCTLCLTLLRWLRGQETALTAALPGIAEICAGIVVLVLFRHNTPRLSGIADRHIMHTLTRLSAPTTASRLCQTAMRALNAVLLPVCLRRSGLSTGEATAQFGLLSGMAMPLLMLPGVVTSAICMVGTPAVSRAEGYPHRLRRTVRLMLFSACGVGWAAMAGLYLGADFLAVHLYHNAQLAPLLRCMCPAALLMSLQQVQYGVITGLGMQAKALTAAVASSAVSLVLTALLAPMPQLGLLGAASALVVSSLMRVLWQQWLLHQAFRPYS